LPEKLPLILPVETHVRELDGKLLLGAIAAERGRDTYVGSQNEIRAKIGTLPFGHFIAKGFASRKARFMGILQSLGFNILAWDEEGLVHPEPEIYYKRRISAESLSFLKGVFAWGRDYETLFKNMPFYDGTPIHIVGNPRIDLLDQRVRNFFAEPAAQLQKEHGRYILLNSNFGRVNSAVKRTRDDGVAGQSTNSELDRKWQEMVEYRRKLYAEFREMFAHLARAFPDYTVILRPHPAERIESWADIPATHKNAKVIYDGGVQPWLLGAEILVHNGCTTALESTLLDKTSIAYMPISSEIHDWHLPNSVSHKITSLAALSETIRAHLQAKPRLVVTPEQRAVLDDFVHHDKDKLGCDLIIDVLEQMDLSFQNHPAKAKRWLGKIHAQLRSWEKSLRALRPGDIYAPWHQDKHFPRFTLAEIQGRLAALQKATGRLQGVEVTEVSAKIFKLSKAR
jgi:surface carbohydrate biosynthesis protein